MKNLNNLGTLIACLLTLASCASDERSSQHQGSLTHQTWEDKVANDNRKKKQENMDAMIEKRAKYIYNGEDPQERIRAYSIAVQQIKAENPNH